MTRFIPLPASGFRLPGSIQLPASRFPLPGFTMIELLIVISIIAILAAAIIPNFIGFDTEARISATKSNLDTLRTRVTLFRAKEGVYPTSLGDLVSRTYVDAGVQKLYLQKIPPELISSKRGSSEHREAKSDEPLTNEGGWLYKTDMAEVIINLDQPLDRSWGEYAGQKPNEW